MTRQLTPLLLVAVGAGLYAQQPPITRTTTTGVVIDVTVVDRNGRAVLDLTPDEFELSEDGKRQKLMSASLVHAGVIRPLEGSAVAAGGPIAVQPPGSGRSATDPASNRTLSVTAILFDRMSPEVQPLAQRAAVAYLATLSPEHDYAGVFGANVNLMTFATFTNKPDMLRAAVDRLGSAAGTIRSPAGEGASDSRVKQLPLDPNQP